jgi:hypothetical protein
MPCHNAAFIKIFRKDIRRIVNEADDRAYGLCVDCVRLDSPPSDCGHVAKVRAQKHP